MAEPPRTRRPRRRGPSDGDVTVFVSDEQNVAAVEPSRWQELALAVLLDEGVEGECEMSVLFVDELTMTDLNNRFMGHEGPTDVLSFPIDGDPTPPGRWPDDGGPGPDRADDTPDDLPLLLGDVVICPAVASRNAPEHAGTFDDEIALLVVHGILHLMGMDHAVEAERNAMQARERELLSAHHGPMTSDPWAAVAVADASDDAAANLVDPITEPDVG